MKVVNQQTTSIQRFLQNRASHLTMSAQAQSSFAGHIGAGISLVLVGVIMGTVGAFNGIAGLAFGALGPIGGGIVNLWLGLALKKRFQQSPNDPKLTPEAKAFLQDLMKQTKTGWNSSHGYGAKKQSQATSAPNPLIEGNTALHQLGKHWGMIPKTPADVLPKGLHDLLDTACFHYNRVHGIVEGARDEPSLAKISQGAKSGADEAIFAILHQAAMMHRYPETADSASRDCEERIRMLKELADRLDRLVTQPISIANRLGYSSAMESVLEEVRLEGKARDELQRTDDSQHLRERL